MGDEADAALCWRKCGDVIAIEADVAVCEAAEAWREGGEKPRWRAIDDGVADEDL